MTQNQRLAVYVLSLLGLAWLIHASPSWLEDSQDGQRPAHRKGQLNAFKTVLAFLLVNIVSYLLVSVVSKNMNRNGGAKGLLNQVGLASTPSSADPTLGPTDPSLTPSY